MSVPFIPTSLNSAARLAQQLANEKKVPVVVVQDVNGHYHHMELSEGDKRVATRIATFFPPGEALPKYKPYSYFHWWPPAVGVNVGGWWNFTITAAPFYLYGYFRGWRVVCGYDCLNFPYLRVSTKPIALKIGKFGLFAGRSYSPKR